MLTALNLPNLGNFEGGCANELVSHRKQCKTPPGGLSLKRIVLPMFKTDNELRLR